MCRLFGTISGTALDPLDLRSHLLDSGTSLLAQSTARRGRIQGDGWGLGHHGPGGRPVVARSTRAVFREKGRLACAIGKVRGPLAVAQIRAASNPLGLSRRSLLRLENQQPFAWKGWLFAHNGILNLPDTLSERIGRHRRLLAGNNDSEVYFRLLMGAIETTGSVVRGFRAAHRTILEDWERAPAERRRKAGRPFVGLNAVLSDGASLYAVCFYDGYRARRPDCWLCPVDPPRPLFEMCFRVEDGGRALVVASERTEPSGEWEPLPDGSLLEARRVGGRIRHRVVRIP